MSSPAVRVEGLQKTLRQLEAYGVAVDDLKGAFRAIAQDVADESHARVRIDTGLLDSTIRPGNSKNKAVVRAGSAAAPYAGVVNYSRPGDEFLTGPANENPEAKVRTIEQELDQLARQLGLA